MVRAVAAKASERVRGWRRREGATVEVGPHQEEPQDPWEHRSFSPPPRMHPLAGQPPQRTLHEVPRAAGPLSHHPCYLGPRTPHSHPPPVALRPGQVPLSPPARPPLSAPLNRRHARLPEHLSPRRLGLCHGRHEGVRILHVAQVQHAAQLRPRRLEVSQVHGLDEERRPGG